MENMENISYNNIPVYAKDSQKRKDWFKQFEDSMKEYKIKNKKKKLIASIVDAIREKRKSQTNYYFEHASKNFNMFQTYDKNVTQFHLNKSCLVSQFNDSKKDIWKNIEKAIDTKEDRMIKESMKLSDNNKWTIKILKKGTPLYHGSYNSMVTRPASPANYNRKFIFSDIIWFAPTINIALQYASGFVHSGQYEYKIGKYKDDTGRLFQDRWDIYVFTTIQDIRLLYINLNTIKMLHAQFPFVSSLVQEIFPIKNNKLERQSAVWFDYLFAQFICIYLGYDGYYAPSIGELYPEIMICNPSQVLSKPKLYVWFAETIKKWIEEVNKNKLKMHSNKDKQIFLKLYTSLAQIK